MDTSQTFEQENDRLLEHYWGAASGDAISATNLFCRRISSAVDGYETLETALIAAYEQAACGKGKERHADEKPFHEQPIFEIAKITGTEFLSGQAVKKIQESLGMERRGQDEMAMEELLGAIVYCAAAYSRLRLARDRRAVESSFSEGKAGVLRTSKK